MDNKEKEIPTEEELQAEAASEWKTQALPRAYLRLEGILHQTAWVMALEIKRQEKAAKAARKLIESEIRNKDTWRNGKQ